MIKPPTNDEIMNILRELKDAEGGLWVGVTDAMVFKAGAKWAQNLIIEECAKVCEWRDTDLDPEDKEYNPDAWGWTSKDYARNIRYLKSKP